MARTVNFSRLSASSVTGRLLRKPLNLIPTSAVLPVLQGPLRGTRWITGSASHGCWLGSYEYSKQLAFAKAVHSADVVYDVGANVGFYTLLASRLVGRQGRVYSFEPFPNNIAVLNRHLRLNDVTNATVFEAAVADKPGHMRFAQGELHQEGRLSETGSIKVRVVSLDDLVLSGLAQPPQLMKIDVEGAELQVLHGAAMILREYKPVIFLATHGKAVHRDCCELLRSYGYFLFSLTQEDVDNTEEIRAVPAREPAPNESEAPAPRD